MTDHCHTPEDLMDKWVKPGGGDKTQKHKNRTSHSKPSPSPCSPGDGRTLFESSISEPLQLHMKPQTIHVHKEPQQKYTTTNGTVHFSLIIIVCDCGRHTAPARSSVSHTDLFTNVQQKATVESLSRARRSESTTSTQHFYPN